MPSALEYKKEFLFWTEYISGYTISLNGKRCHFLSRVGITRTALFFSFLISIIRALLYRFRNDRAIFLVRAQHRGIIHATHAGDRSNSYFTYTRASNVSIKTFSMSQIRGTFRNQPIYTHDAHRGYVIKLRRACI